MALTFLESLERALKNEPEFGEVFDQRASEHMLADLAAIRGRLGAGAPTAGTKRDYLRWLIGRNLYLDPRGTLQTQRQVQLKLDTIYVTLRAQREEAAAAVDRRLVEQELLDLDSKLAADGLSAEEIEDHRDTLVARKQSGAAVSVTEVVPLSQLPRITATSSSSATLAAGRRHCSVTSR